MATRIAIFTEDDGKKIAQVTRDVLNEPADGRGRRDRGVKSSSLWAKITDSAKHSSIYRHSWTEQIRHGADYVNALH